MSQLKMHTPDLSAANIDKIALLFPNCITEAKDEKGQLRKSVDFDQLRQELSDSVVEGPVERYTLNWPGKREAIVAANTPVYKTLRPCEAESVDFDTTKNLYIEGDNLEVLKLLQETYLGKVKMIYIDPPYNTGNDFIYDDDFAVDVQDDLLKSAQKDEAGGRLVSNPESNGRFHSDWLSMMYPRLKLARDLLKDDGVIFISIDDNEVHNLRKLCDEVLGVDNFISEIVSVNKPSGRSDDKYIAGSHEYILVYRKSVTFQMGLFEPENHIIRRYTHTDASGLKYREEDLRKRGSHDERTDRPNLFYPFFYSESTGDFYCGECADETPPGYVRIEPLKTSTIQGTWRWEKATARLNKKYLHPRYMPNKRQWSVFEWEYLDERSGVKPTSLWNFKDVNSERGSELFADLGFGSKTFQNPKPIGTIKRALILSQSNTSKSTGEAPPIILDFFSGSATTAHAVMQLNAEDGGNRRFIMVQLPEVCDEKSEAFKAGYKNICEIGKERIRRAGQKIKEDSATTAPNLDIGFRVFKLDSSNMKDVYYTPDEVDQSKLGLSEDAIKEDRTPEDLLFQVFLDSGLDLALPVKEEKIDGKTVYVVDEKVLVACFDNDIPESLIQTLARRQPLKAVFLDRSFAKDSGKINVTQIFKQLSPETTVKTL